MGAVLLALNPEPLGVGWSGTIIGPRACRLRRGRRWSPRRCRGSVGTTPRMGTGPVPRGCHSWSRTSSRSSNLPGRLFTGWAAEVYERRDSALLLMGFAGGVSAERPRRSEQRGRSQVPVGRVHVRLRRSKTDRKANGPFAHCRSPPPAPVVRRARTFGGRRSFLHAIPPAVLVSSGFCAPLSRSVVMSVGVRCRGCGLGRRCFNDVRTATSPRQRCPVRRCRRRSAARPGCGHDGNRSPTRRAFSPSGFRHPGLPQRCRRARHHAPDRPQPPGHRGNLCAGERPADRQCVTEIGL